MQSSQDESSADLTAAGDKPREQKERYGYLLRQVVLAVGAVSLLPLLIMTLITYQQYKAAFKAEMVEPISRLTSGSKRSFEFFLSERLSAMKLVVNDKSIQQLSDREELRLLLANLKNSFGGFIDLGLIHEEGRQVSYAGPFKLEGRNYRDQDWFHEVSLRGVYISDVFKGFRGFPHFVIAVKFEKKEGDFHVLRATIDSEMLNRQILQSGSARSSDAFLINRDGVLQSPSRFYGDVLEKYPDAVPHYSERVEVLDLYDEKNQHIILGYAYIDNSPFIYMLAMYPDAVMGNWESLRNKIIGFFALSATVILVVILWGSYYLVGRIRKADMERRAFIHKMEYTNKMATLGRLAAGVAHEINNPMAIINEKAGLMRDLVSISEDFPRKEKSLSIVDSILKSVDRVSAITHRLLGFAKHMDLQTQKIDLENLLKEVLSFMDKEAAYRNVSVNFHVAPDLPLIESDRGQLQQVFLNIINNALAAVDDGGKLDIGMKKVDDKNVAVTVADDGIGISEENLEHIFEPFFTTKKGSGTGLGLSITYGIIEKLGGKLGVKSKVGEGSSFTVSLPVRKMDY